MHIYIYIVTCMCQQVLNSSRTRGVKHRCETLSIGGRALVLRYPLHPPGAEGQGSLEDW